LNALLQTLRNLGPLRLAALGGVAIALIAFFAFVTTRLSSTDMSLLYAELEMADSAKIVERLETLGVPYELKADGSQIKVPADQVLRLRMAMASEGLPAGGSIGYEIFDRENALGTTNFVQQVNHLRALEGELARTIGSIAQIKSARVHLVIPQRELFSRDKPQPSASIILVQRGAIDRSQVVAIQHLVAAAVPGLKPAAVSVVDEQGNLLARGTDDRSANPVGAEEMRLAYENRMRRSIEELLQRSLGYGKIRAEVTAEMNFDRITTNSETYDPDGQVVRSTQTVEEQSDSTEGAADAVTVANNLPDPTLQDAASQSRSTTARTEETVNYEITKTVETHVSEAGTVRRLSVAVLVDGIYSTAEDGTLTYEPRSGEELEKIAKLVRSAVGFDQARGDSVEVVNMRFVDNTAELTDPNALPFGLEKADLIRIAEMLVLGIVAVLVMLLVVRPMIGRLLESAEADAGQGLLTDQTAPAPALAGPAGGPGELPAPTQTDVADQIEKMIDINQVEGRVRESSLKKISELVDRHPEEAVNIMRSWLYQET
jgi:flagellar M-ring protein FliF